MQLKSPLPEAAVSDESTAVSIGGTALDPSMKMIHLSRPWVPPPLASGPWGPAPVPRHTVGSQRVTSCRDAGVAWKDSSRFMEKRV